ncbi:MAG TPA: CBS domain-containing protein [Methylomirabilota bacterium]|jgi:acetoin utilization protein AcuB
MRIDPYQGSGDEHVAWPEPICVRDWMSQPAVTVPATAPVAEALWRMADHRIHYLPVVNDEGGLIGIVNEDDVLGTRRGARMPDEIVAEVMSAPAVSVDPTQSLKEAMGLMVGRSIGALPVVEDGRVIGILTQSDIVAALAQTRA